MAILSITNSFVARHGTRNVRQSTFTVELNIRGPLLGEFVVGVDDRDIHARLESEVGMLQETYLDDKLGRATLENIAAFLLMRLQDHPVDSISVAVDGTRVMVMMDELEYETWEAEVAFRRGVSLLVRGEADRALDAFSAATRLAPEWATAYNARGRCLRRLDRIEEALEDFGCAIRNVPSFGEAYRNRANAILELAGAEEALPVFDKAVRLLPWSALAHNNRGYALRLIGKFELALLDHDQAIKLNPQYEEAYRDRAVVLSELGKVHQAKTDITYANELASDTNEIELERMKLVYRPLSK